MISPWTSASLASRNISLPRGPAAQTVGVEGKRLGWSFRHRRRPVQTRGDQRGEVSVRDDALVRDADHEALRLRVQSNRLVLLLVQGRLVAGDLAKQADALPEF